MTIQVRRVTMKSLQEALQRRIAENDDLRSRNDHQSKLLGQQTRMLNEAWALERELQRRLDTIAKILGGALLVALPRVETGQCDVAMSPESQR